MRILRPVHKRWGEFRWAHIDDKGKPLCGEVPGSDYELRIEIVEPAKFSMCLQCRHALNHYAIEVLQSGQARSYQDSQYVYRVTDLQDPPREREEVLAYCQEHVRKSYRREDMPSWASPELREFSQIEPGVWRYVVREAYTG